MCTSTSLRQTNYLIQLFLNQTKKFVIFIRKKMNIYRRLREDKS